MGVKQVSKAGSNLVELPLWNLVVARDDGKTGPSECVARAAAGQRLEMLVFSIFGWRPGEARRD